MAIRKVPTLENTTKPFSKIGYFIQQWKSFDLQVLNWIANSIRGTDNYTVMFNVKAWLTPRGQQLFSSYPFTSGFKLSFSVEYKL